MKKQINSTALVARAKEEFSARSDSGWDWSRLDYSITHRNADLNPGGARGIEVVSTSDLGTLNLIAHGMMTVVGKGACLNIPVDFTDEEYCNAHEAYLSGVESLVMGCDQPGEWDGENWIMSAAVPFSITMKPGGPTGVDWDATVELAVAAAERALEEWRRKMEYIDQQASFLAGYTHDKKDPTRTVANPPLPAWVDSRGKPLWKD